MNRAHSLLALLPLGFALSSGDALADQRIAPTTSQPPMKRKGRLLRKSSTT
jgi:hypothetical protein